MRVRSRRGKKAETRWDRFYREQMKDTEFRRMVEEELAELRIGVQIARLREQEKLTQTKLAARAGLARSKISFIERAPRNLTIETLIRIARAANRHLKM